MKLMIALAIWLVAGVVFFVTNAAPPNSLPMADPMSEETGEVVDLVDGLFVTTGEVVEEHRESVGVAAASMVAAAAVGSLVGLGLFTLVADPPRLWPLRSIEILLCIASLWVVWGYGRASLEVWPSDALGSAAVGITSMTILLLVGLMRGSVVDPRLNRTTNPGFQPPPSAVVSRASLER